MKKKFLLTAMLLVSVIVFAKNWIIHTTCGATGTLQTSDNVTDAQLIQYVNAINYDLCGSIPKGVSIQP
ncbi:hypothetical protein M2347_002527 [Chryseobacterium sp. H1D6B]|uniref:hypothetical protein n=1 Tax=Chryseobacterium sp. H1D6B TaxID=2940588 RepID=UPI0015CDE288|nr:hypothetical protein [Chryseobacterium sp. H1D6B]MDH6252800.1 hypothetical protein [Chryseobacterium sp. H1D6B]